MELTVDGNLSIGALYKLVRTEAKCRKQFELRTPYPATGVCGGGLVD